MLVKKSDEVGAVQLAKTQASFDFQSNEGQIVFDGDVIPDVTNLYLGYIPNDEAPRDPSVVLICPCDSGTLWMHEIEPRAAVVVGEIGHSAPDEAAEEILVRIPEEPTAKEE